MTCLNLIGGGQFLSVLSYAPRTSLSVFKSSMPALPKSDPSKEIRRAITTNVLAVIECIFHIFHANNDHERTDTSIPLCMWSRGIYGGSSEPQKCLFDDFYGRAVISLSMGAPKQHPAACRHTTRLSSDFGCLIGRQYAGSQVSLPEAGEKMASRYDFRDDGRHG